MGWAYTRIRAQPVQVARQATVSRKKLSGLPTCPCVFYSHLHLPSILTMLAHLNLSWCPDTYQTLSNPPRGVKTGYRAEVRAHFPAGLLKAPAPLPQVFLTVPRTFTASAKSVYAAPSHLCSPPILPPSSTPHPLLPTVPYIDKNHFCLQPKPSQLPLKISKKIFLQIQKEAMSSEPVIQMFPLNSSFFAFH